MISESQKTSTFVTLDHFPMVRPLMPAFREKRGKGRPVTRDQEALRMSAFRRESRSHGERPHVVFESA